MKKFDYFFSIIILSILFFSCIPVRFGPSPYDKVIAVEDDFTGELLLYLETSFFAVPSDNSISARMINQIVYIKFEKVLKEGKETGFSMVFNSRLWPNEDLRNKIIIKSGDEIFDFRLSSIDNVYYTVTHEEEIEETIGVGENEETIITTEITKTNLKNCKSTLIFSQELKRNILSSRVVEVRFYLNNYPYTFTIDGEKLDELKHLIEVNTIEDIAPN